MMTKREALESLSQKQMKAASFHQFLVSDSCSKSSEVREAEHRVMTIHAARQEIQKTEDPITIMEIFDSVED